MGASVTDIDRARRLHPSNVRPRLRVVGSETALSGVTSPPLAEVVPMRPEGHSEPQDVA